MGVRAVKTESCSSIRKEQGTPGGDSLLQADRPHVNMAGEFLTRDVEKDTVLNAFLTSAFTSKTGLHPRHAHWKVWNKEDLSLEKGNTEEDLNQVDTSRKPESLHPQMLRELVDVTAAQLRYP